MWRVQWITGCSVLASFFSAWASARGVERPQIQLIHHSAGELHAMECNVLVMGSVQPALQANVEVRIYHVQDDGGLMYQAGASIHLQGDQIGPLSIRAPPGGWKPGTLRCIVYLNQMPQVRSHFDVSIVEGNLASPKAVYEPKISDVVVDADNAPKGGWTINAGDRFYVRGTVILPERFDFQGPSVIADVVRPATEERAQITVAGGMTYCLIELPTIGEYEVEIDAPRRPGEYVFRVYEPSFAGGQEVKPLTMLFPLTVRPAMSAQELLPRLD
jgi:hypothetical protein